MPTPSRRHTFICLLTCFCLLVPLGTSMAAQQAVNATSQDRSSGAFDGPAELPRVYVKSSLADTPAPGRTRLAKDMNDLEKAIKESQCGDTIKLAARATFAGRLRLPAKPCDDAHWIILRTDAPDSALPPEGTRITPCFAGVASLPERPEYHCSSPTNVMAKIILTLPGDGPIVFEEGANHYRFIGLEITRDNPGKSVHRLAFLDKDANADHLVFDRVWMHGAAQEETGKGVQLGGSGFVAVVDSFFSDFHCVAMTGACTDSQAIGGGNGGRPMGPYKIVNNYLEAAGEPILFGGAGATKTPADIEIRHNYMFKPLSWKPGHPAFVGGASGHPFIVKNLFELKNAQRVLFDGNILENTWGGFSQTGFAVLLTPKNQSPNVCPLCRVTDITIRNSRISHVASCFQIGNGLSDTGGAATDGGRYSIHDVICDDIDPERYKGFGNFAQVSQAAPPLHDVSIDHVTGFAVNALFNMGAQGVGARITNFSFTNNLVGSGMKQITSTGGKTNCAFQAQRLAPKDVLDGCVAGLKFTDNAIIGGGGGWPKGNFTPKNPSAVRFVDYKNANGGDYRLAPDSPFRKKGSDGKDLGADVDAIEKATAGVR
jgi:hypothetical protein